MSLSDIVFKAQNLGLASLRLPELREIAAGLGLRRVTGVRKGDLIAAIEEAGGVNRINISAGAYSAPRSSSASAFSSAPAPQAERASADEQDNVTQNNAADVNDSHVASDGEDSEDKFAHSSRFSNHKTQAQLRRERRRRQKANAQNTESSVNEENDHSSSDIRTSERPDRTRSQERERDNRDYGREDSDYDQGDRRNRRNRRDRRGRNDNRNNRDNRGNRDNRDNRDSRRDNRENDANSHQVSADQLTAIEGTLDFADANTAFIRVTGFHPGSSDVYVPMNMVRKHGMRQGDYIRGAIRQRSQSHQNNNNRGRQRQKYSPLYSVDTVNGLTPEEAAQRPHFHKMTPLYPNQRLRLETQPKILTTRVIDLVMPIGKGQRALIVSPPKAGKTTILQDIANAIQINNPECYLMVVLVDERPEEVTDMQRSVKGEVIASTFDRPPSEHTNVAELAIERAKRLVEQGADVVVLLDSITRLGRAYNNSSPASGRILSGGVDSNALYPPKRFLGAARNIENGGSLTIIATAMVETGSAGDTVIFEEFKGTGNAELKLDRKIAERRVFPAVDVNPSGTRKDELLLNPDEAKVMHKLRRILSALDNQDAIDLLIKQLRKTKNNMEFLMQVASSGPLVDDTEDGE